MRKVVGFRADPDVAVDPSERVDLKGRVETRGIQQGSEDFADCTGPVDRED